MEGFDNDSAIESLTSDEELLMMYVVREEYELLYLDTYLTETFRHG